MSEVLLSVKDLAIGFHSSTGDKTVVRQVSFDLRAGEVLAVVGESGSGKTMIARSILGLLPADGRVMHGSIMFQGEDLAALPQKALRGVRGTAISMIFQEPMVSLNPALKIGQQMCEAARHHTDTPLANIRSQAIDLLKRVRIKDAEGCLDRYPHEFSGGMRQRIMIASALMLKPALLIADEPTTALDCVVQKEVLDILLDVTKEEGTAVLFISHDLGLVAHYSDKILVMNKGDMMETGSVRDILNAPKHAYTKKLLAALPHPGGKPAIKDGDTILRVRDLCVDYPIRKNWFWEQQAYDQVLFDVRFDLHQGETLAVVGESGSGKTTLGRSVLQLMSPRDGIIELDGETLSDQHRPDHRSLRKIVQPIFQDPYATLSPRRSIGQSLAEPLGMDSNLSSEEIHERVMAMLEKVELSADFADRLPHELSGGQRQRVAIGRALISEPKLVIADEPVSALDITVQAQILELLTDLKESIGFTLLFISHDLGVVEQISDRVLIMKNGRILEEGNSEAIFSTPAHSYTRQLLAALPELRSQGENRYALQRRVFEPVSLEGAYIEYSEKHKKPPVRLKLAENHTILATKAT